MGRPHDVQWLLMDERCQWQSGAACESRQLVFSEAYASGQYDNRAGVSTISRLTCGPRHARGRERQAHRWGKTNGKIAFHGGKVDIERPRLRGLTGRSILCAYADPPSQNIMKRGGSGDERFPPQPQAAASCHNVRVRIATHKGHAVYQTRQVCG